MWKKERARQKFEMNDNSNLDIPREKYECA